MAHLLAFALVGIVVVIVTRERLGTSRKSQHPQGNSAAGREVS